MNVNDLKKSNFLKKEDCGPSGILVTIANVTEENIAKEGAPEEMKYCLHLAECEKPMVLNSTNGQIIAAITGSQESDGWIGKKIVLYNEPSVSYAGKVTGGIRVRAPRGKAAQNAPPTREPVKLAPEPIQKPTPLPGQHAPEPDGEPDEDNVPF